MSGKVEDMQADQARAAADRAAETAALKKMMSQAMEAVDISNAAVHPSAERTLITSEPRMSMASEGQPCPTSPVPSTPCGPPLAAEGTVVSELKKIHSRLDDIQEGWNKGADFAEKYFVSKEASDGIEQMKRRLDEVSEELNAEKRMRINHGDTLNRLLSSQSMSCFAWLRSGSPGAPLPPSAGSRSDGGIPGFPVDEDSI